MHMSSSLEVHINQSTPQQHATQLSLSTTSFSECSPIPSGGAHNVDVSTNSRMPMDRSDDNCHRNPLPLPLRKFKKDAVTTMDLMISLECNNGQIAHPNCQHPGRRLVGTRLYDSTLGVTCHWCRQKTVEDHVQCCECTITFCGGCLKNRHGEFIHIEMQDGVDWVCPKCRGGCGAGCNNCCNCGPCRRAQGLEPTGLLVYTARAHGFNNVHDYLIHQITGESPERIAKRKRGRAWCQTSELSLTKRLKLENEHVERMKYVNSCGDIGLRKSPIFNLSDSRQQDIEDDNRHAILPYDRSGILPYAIPFPANIVPQPNLGLDMQYQLPSIQLQEMEMAYPKTLVPYAQHVHVDNYQWYSQFIHVKEEPIECLRSESPPEEKGFIRTKILQDEQLKKQKSIPDQSLMEKEQLLGEGKAGDACRNRSLEFFQDSEQVGQPNVVVAPHNYSQTSLKMASEFIKHQSNDHLKSPKGSSICNIQGKKTNHQIEDFSLDVSIDREQKPLFAFECTIAKDGRESVTGISQHREIDLIRDLNKSLNTKDTHVSHVLESTVASSGTPVLQNVKVKDEFADPILLSHISCERDKVLPSHQLDGKFQGFVINKGNNDHWPSTSKVPDPKKKGMVAKSGFKSKLATRLSEPFRIEELEILTRAISIKQPLYKSCENTVGYAQFISRAEISCLDHHPELASQLESSSSPELRLSLLRGFFFWLEHARLEDSFKPWTEQTSPTSLSAHFDI